MEQIREFVGHEVEVGNFKLRVKRVIAEGQFALILLAQDLNTGHDYALKKLMAVDKEADIVIMQEINILKRLSGHPNIIELKSEYSIDKDKTGHGMKEYIILLELCTGGSLLDVLKARSKPLPPDVVCRIFYQTCRAVQHMHSQEPSITHRDLKIENLLLGADGLLKLCDFGSATSQKSKVDLTWSTTNLEEMRRYTSPINFAPEMLALGHFTSEIGLPIDVWALGCILYMLCYIKHPFEGSEEPDILEAKFTFPTETIYQDFHTIIRSCLISDPRERASVTDLLGQVAALAETRGFNLKEPLNFEGRRLDAASVAQYQQQPGTSPAAPPRIVSSSSTPSQKPLPLRPGSSPAHQPTSVSQHQTPVDMLCATLESCHLNSDSDVCDSAVLASPDWGKHLEMEGSKRVTVTEQSMAEEFRQNQMPILSDNSDFDLSNPGPFRMSDIKKFMNSSILVNKSELEKYRQGSKHLDNDSDSDSDWIVESSIVLADSPELFAAQCKGCEDLQAKLRAAEREIAELKCLLRKPEDEEKEKKEERGQRKRLRSSSAPPSISERTSFSREYRLALAVLVKKYAQLKSVRWIKMQEDPYY